MWKKSIENGVILQYNSVELKSIEFNSSSIDFSILTVYLTNIHSTLRTTPIEFPFSILFIAKNKLEQCFHGYFLDKEFTEASEIKHDI